VEQAVRIKTAEPEHQRNSFSGQGDIAETQFEILRANLR
jgi:hypothetical protein